MNNESISQANQDCEPKELGSNPDVSRIKNECRQTLMESIENNPIDSSVEEVWSQLQSDFSVELLIKTIEKVPMLAERATIELLSRDIHPDIFKGYDTRIIMKNVPSLAVQMGRTILENDPFIEVILEVLDNVPSLREMAWKKFLNSAADLAYEKLLTDDIFLPNPGRYESLVRQKFIGLKQS